MIAIDTAVAMKLPYDRPPRVALSSESARRNASSESPRPIAAQASPVTSSGLTTGYLMFPTTCKSSIRGKSRSAQAAYAKIAAKRLTHFCRWRSRGPAPAQAARYLAAGDR